MRVINLENVGQPTALYRDGPSASLRIGLNPDSLLPTESFKPLGALIDTGATISSIDETVADLLKLPPVGTPESHVGANGPFKSQPVIGFVEIVGFDILVYRRFATLPLISNGAKYHAILGRDFLSLGVFTYDGLAGTCKMQIP